MNKIKIFRLNRNGNQESIEAHINNWLFMNSAIITKMSTAYDHDELWITIIYTKE
jgi:hypothetical protein